MGMAPSLKSSVKLLAGALESNGTYQFMGRLKNRLNASVRAIGFSLIHIVDTRPPMIAIR
jgi:hypothetical protein